jgi:hypothetical protein
VENGGALAGRGEGIRVAKDEGEKRKGGLGEM